MIRINLLPVRHSRRQEAVKSEVIVASIGVALMCMAMGGLYFVVHGQLSVARAENRALQKRIDQTREIVAEVDEQGDPPQYRHGHLHSRVRVVVRCRKTHILINCAYRWNQ